MSNNDTIETLDILAMSFCNDNGKVTNKVDMNTIEFLLASICE